jgi:hypothetical protein
MRHPLRRDRERRARLGDPQIEQLTYEPVTHAVGEDWPFVEGACAF